MNRMTLPSLLLAMAVTAIPDTQASPADSTKSARSVSPPIHALQRVSQKSGADKAVKPALPPRRRGPVLELDATLGADGGLRLHCDQHDAEQPSPAGASR